MEPLNLELQMKHMRTAKASGCFRRTAVFTTAAWRSQDWKDSSGMTQALCLDMRDQGLNLNIWFESKVTREVTHFLRRCNFHLGYYGVSVVSCTNSVTKYVWICTTKSLNFDDFIFSCFKRRLFSRFNARSSIKIINSGNYREDIKLKCSI